MSGDLRSLGASCPALAHVEKQLRGSLDLLQVQTGPWGGGWGPLAQARVCGALGPQSILRSPRSPGPSQEWVSPHVPTLSPEPALLWAPLSYQRILGTKLLAPELTCGQVTWF